MNESLAKYLAGLLDADGSLAFQKRTIPGESNIWFGLELFLGSADTIDKNGFVASLPDLTGFGSVFRRFAPTGVTEQTVWRVRRRADLEMLLPRVIKHMVIKAKHWQWVLDTWREHRSRGYGNTCLSEDEWKALVEESKASRRERVGPLKPKNHPTWAWLTGFLDGDGYYSFRTSRNRNMRVGVTTHVDDASVLYFLQNAFGGEVKAYPTKPSPREWSRGLGPANGSFALRFLPNLVKHSRLKKHKIEQMIHWHRQRLSVLGTEGIDRRRGRLPERFVCDTPKCNRDHYARGKCKMHYNHAWRDGKFGVSDSLNAS